MYSRQGALEEPQYWSGGLDLAAMIGEKDVPKVIAQGVLDLNDLPGEGEERTITVLLIRPLTSRPIGSLTLLRRA